MSRIDFVGSITLRQKWSEYDSIPLRKSVVELKFKDIEVSYITLGDLGWNQGSFTIKKNGSAIFFCDVPSKHVDEIYPNIFHVEKWNRIVDIVDQGLEKLDFDGIIDKISKLKRDNEL